MEVIIDSVSADIADLTIQNTSDLSRQPLFSCFCIWAPIFKWYEVWCGSKNAYQKDMFKKDWIPFSKYDNQSMFNSQRN